MRAWWEDGAFRARVVYRVDSETGAEVSVLTSDAEELYQQLRTWLVTAAAGAEE